MKLLAVTALAAAALAIPAAPASAVGSPGCVTRLEMRTVDIGDRRVHVHREFETRGLLAARSRNLIAREYVMCNGRDTMRATYVSKHGHGDDDDRRTIRWYLKSMQIQ